MSAALRVVFGVALLLYPILVYVGLQELSVRTLALLLLAVVVIRGVIQAKSISQAGVAGWLMMMVAALILVAALATNSQRYFLYYPVVMNLAMLGLFASSILFPPTVIERLARLHEPELPPDGVAYTRKVTLVWCVFFIINGAFAWYTVSFCSIEHWTLYNGLLAYIAMAVLFFAEFCYRHLVVKR